MNPLIGGLGKVQKAFRENSPAILAALGVSGTVTTAYLTGKASFEAADRLSEKTPYRSTRETVELVWDLYIPAAVSGAVTIGCIIAATRVSSKRAAAAYSVLTVSEKAFEEYREKVIEKLGERKEKEVRDEVAQSRVNQNPVGSTLVVGAGSVLCCEMFTGRYFACDMETLRRAENDVNAKLVREMYATMNDFYYIVGLDTTTNSGSLGWESDRHMSLEFSTAIATDGRPCLTFEYNYTKPL